MKRTAIFSGFIGTVFAILICLSNVAPAFAQDTLLYQNWESGIGNWWVDNGVWEVGVPTSGPWSAYSGQNCAGTILNGNYLNNANTRLISPNIPLPDILPGETIRFKFWHWFSTDDDYDIGRIQVSVSGGAWQTISGNIEGSSPVWNQVSVDLSAYTNSTIRIAFYFTSNWTTTSSGWYVDNISLVVGEETFNNPEYFEGGFGDWWADNGLWEVGVPTVGPDSAFSGSCCAGTVLNGNYSNDSNTRLISPNIVLTPAAGSFPGLFFWHWFNTGVNYDVGWVQISVNGGGWQTIAGPYSGSSPIWSQVFVDLFAYSNSSVRIGFYFTSNWTSTSSGWYIDDVRIEGIITGLGEPEIVLSTDSLDFDTVQMGNQADLPLTIYNIGDDTLVLYDIYTSDPSFTTDFDPADSLIAPDDSLMLTVFFSPQENTAYFETLTIENNDEPVEVMLLGVGIGSVTVTLTPYNPPIIIPENGGSFDFNIQISNNTAEPQTIDIWTEIVLPEVGWMEIINISDYTITAGSSPDRDRNQEVPAFAPAGTYTYYACIGDYPWVIDHHDSFTFIKEGTDDGYLGTTADWLCSGEPFEGEFITNSLPEVFALHAPYPNPFNPETNLTFDLPQAGEVSLIIYDIQGREVVRLVDGYQATGFYKLSWNAGDNPSGVYFARLKTNEFSQTRKLLLVK